MNTGTSTLTTSKYNYDRITNEFLQWVRNAELESDAVANIQILLRQYDRRKTLWQKVKAIFSSH